MKKIAMFLFLALATVMVGQQDPYQNQLNSDNSYYTLLDSAGTFTGKWYPTQGYNSIIVVTKSNKSSATSGLIIEYGRKAVTNSLTYYLTSTALASYTANDSITNRVSVPVAGEYFRVRYINGASAQTGRFSLQTFLSKAVQVVSVTIGAVSVGSVIVSSSALPSGASTLAKQDETIDTLKTIRSDLIIIKGYQLAARDSIIQITIATKACRDKLDSVRVDLALLHSDLLAGAIKTDTTNVRLSRIEINQGDGSQKTQVVDGSGNVVGATSNALDINIKSSGVTLGTTNGSLEATQLLVLAELENRINLGGLQTYSVRRGDFTATPVVGGKAVAISGAPFTVSYLNFAYGYVRNSSTGAFRMLKNTDVRDSVAGTSIRFDDESSGFLSTDVVELVFIAAEKTIDKTLNLARVAEMSPLSSRYNATELIDSTNAVAGTRYYPSSLGESMDGYRELSLSGKFIDADSTITMTVECTNDEDYTNADWVQVYFTDLKNNTTVNSISATHTTTTFAIKLTSFNFTWYRVKLVIGDATNTIIVKQRKVW